MKKLGIVFICLFLMGCQTKENQPTQASEDVSVTNTDGIGQYQMNDIILEIIKTDEDGFEFTVEMFEKGFGGYAYFHDYHEATYESGEDGHTLHMILNDDSIIVEESGGMTYLGVELSGEYER